VEAPIALDSSLPDNRRNFCEAKSRLYFAIKDISGAACAGDEVAKRGGVGA
jgi:hypothetical protein